MFSSIVIVKAQIITMFKGCQLKIWAKCICVDVGLNSMGHWVQNSEYASVQIIILTLFVKQEVLI